MTKLRISDDLSLPEDAVTRTFVVYGGKGKGKTNFGSVLVEELAKQHLRFCVTDPLDVWWGLQHGKTKDGGGIDVVILGGAHGDIAITPDAGEIVADFVADEPVNTVIVMRHPDGRMWTNGERIRFMAKLVRRLFARQGERRLPVMLVIDEAGRFVPQIAQKGDADINECIGAIEELVEWGRNVGIGACLITQRSARMNKSVSELAECMIAFQTAGPLSIAAIVDWFGEHIPKVRQNELVGILRELPVGRALVVSPEWLHFEGEAQIRLRETFDSSATPKAGGALRAPGRARKPDLEKYRVRMAETIERAKADDPRALRAALAAKDKRIRELEGNEIAILMRAKDEATEALRKVATKPKEIYVLKDSQIARLEKAAERLEGAGIAYAGLVQITSEIGHTIRSALSLVRSTSRPAVESTRVRAAAPAGGGEATAGAGKAASTRGDASPLAVGGSSAPRPGITVGVTPDPAARTTEGVSGPQQRILDALRFLEELRVRPATRAAAAFVAEVSSESSGFEKNVGKLRTLGLITFPTQGALELTDAGRAAAADPDLGVTSAQLQESIYRRLSGPQAAILRELVDLYPASLKRDYLAERSGQSETSSGFEKNVGRLRSLGLVDYPGPGLARANDVLFLLEAR